MTRPLALPFAPPDPFTAPSASVEPDATHRYLLVRRWGPGSLAGWVCLNPSTADATELDPTTRRIRGYSRAWGYDGFALVNLFALRATDPADLARALESGDPADVVGAESDDWTRQLAARCAIVVCAWGSPRWPAVQRRAAAVHRLLADVTNPLRLGPPLQGGHPRHPLYAHGSLGPVHHPVLGGAHGR